jgi:hypothetical protein
VPKSVIRALDVTNVLMGALETTSSPIGLGPVLALNSVDSYLDAAKRQRCRIERARAAAFMGIRLRKHIHGNLFNDVHFYLICWARIAKLGRFIADKTRFKRVGLVLRRYHAELKERIDCRDHLEHFEERLPGGMKQDRLPVPNDLLNMINQYVTYGGRKLDVGPDSMRLLQTIVAEFRTAILFDAVETLVTTDVDRLSDLFQQAVSNIQITKVTRAVQKRMEASGLAGRSITPPTARNLITNQSSRSRKLSG